MRFEPALTPSQDLALKRDTAQRVAKTLTKKQIAGLIRIRDKGPMAWADGGRAGGAISRMFDRMVDAGLCTKPPMVVTEFGHRVLAELAAAK